MRKTVKGAVIAAAVALMFAGTVQAADQGSGQGQKAEVKCLGANSCKGQGSCKTAQNDCKGQNSCKGKGYVVTEDEKSCTAMGGHVGDKVPTNM